jgi:hypothetical protein
MRSIALLLLLVALGGCSARDWDRYRRNNDGWNDDWNDRYRNVDDCQRGRGRVNMRKWQQRVNDFSSKAYKNKKNFQTAKQNLLSDLASERSKACNWETRRVDDMMAQVRAQRW